MERAIPMLQWASTLSFVALALVSFGQYRRLRDSGTRWLAASFGLLGAVSLLGRFTASRDTTDWINDVSLVGFMASGYTLLRFREILKPMSSRFKRSSGVVMFASVGFAIAADLPPRGVAPEGIQTVAILSVILVWNIAVMDTAIRFWIAARGRPAVQGARLRALSLGYGSIVVLLMVAGGVLAGDAVSTAVDFWVALGALVIVPLLAIAVLPPRWLRSLWRVREEEALRNSLHDLMRISQDRNELAAVSVENALRLTGGGFGRLYFDDELIAERGDRGLADGPRVSIEFPTSAADGRLEIAASPLTPYFGRDEQHRLEQYVVSIAVAFERVALHEELREQSQTYASLLDALSALDQGIVVERAGVVEYANDAYRRIIGYIDEPLEALPGLHALIGLPASAPVRTESAGRRAAITRLDGSDLHIEYSARTIDTGVTRTMAVVRDVTEQWVVEREHGLLRTTAVGVASAESLDASLRAVLASVATTGRWRFAEAWLPQGSDLVLAAVWRHPEIPMPDDDEQYIGRSGPFGVALSSNRVGWIPDIREDAAFLRMNPGVRRALGAACVVPVIDAGEPIALLVYYLGRPGPRQDRVCEVLSSVASQLAVAIKRRRSDASLVTYTGELERRNRELQEFSYAASHDLQEPLRMVTSFVKLLGDRYTERLDGDALEFIDFAVQGAERMRSLIYDLLELTRIETRGETPVKMDLGLCVEDAKKDLLLAIEESGIKIECADLDEVPADRGQMSRVFQNLMSNAIKFRGVAPPVIKIWSERRGAQVIVAVQDNGIGIEPAFVERVFGLFTRLNRREDQEGSGVGLAISKRIVERHGGRLWVEAAPHGGSIFRFSLPIEGGAHVWSIPA